HPLFAHERPELVRLDFREPEVAREQLGYRLGVLPRALDPRGDRLVTVARLLLRGTQAPTMQHHPNRADDLRDIRLPTIQGSPQGLAERSTTGEATPPRPSVPPSCADDVGRLTARAGWIPRVAGPPRRVLLISPTVQSSHRGDYTGSPRRAITVR